MMRNDSLETLLLRHYGSTAPAPEHLEQHLIASVHRESARMEHEALTAKRLSQRRISRRQAVRLVALGSAGLGLLSAAIGEIQALEGSLLGQELAYS